MSSINLKKPKSFRAQRFKDPQKALDAVIEIYNTHTQYLRSAFQAFAQSEAASGKRISGYYPYVRIETKVAGRADRRRSYGFVPRPGVYETTLSAPDILGEYYLQQFTQLLANHEGAALEVGVSDVPIPIHFALGTDFYLEGDLSEQQIAALPDLFDVPNLDIMNDEISNSTYVQKDGDPAPLSLFTAPRVDISVQRLKHYCGTSARHFQKYVIFTNYQFYIDEFIAMSNSLVRGGDDTTYTAFVEPGDKVTLNNVVKNNKEDVAGEYPLSRMPQMPAYHLKMPGNNGITIVNIGVGPSNAKTITDHIAVLRPHSWLMLGHCAGLRNTQNLGDYVLAHGYLREDNILDEDLDPSIPIPALAEIQQALEQAVAQVTGNEGYDLKTVMRTGTVATTDDRNWELAPEIRQNRRLSQSRAIAMDMESGTIAANGFRFRVPYGTLLCVSDKPLHGQLKLPGMADSFYRERVEQHFQVGVLTMTLLRDLKPEKLHSRKLRSFHEVAFQ